MFDVGFSELMVIAVVALIVIGPERLPKVARTAGHLLGRLQRYVNDVKADINREMQLEELKKLQGQLQDSARNFESAIQQGMASTEKSLNEAIQPPTPTAEPTPAVEADVAAAPTPAHAPAQVAESAQAPADISKS
ncbi:MAG: Sec-independent protein translocase subunit TatB [Betaproteobacteria bacterium]|nr:Sec-independent protein translocase subunit TatB [Betaproteobacteria bacterium]